MKSRTALSLILATVLTLIISKVASSVGEVKKESETEYPLLIYRPIYVEKKDEENEEIKQEQEEVKYEQFIVTAYTSGYESTGKRKGHPLYGITASGNKVKENHTLACPKSMEFGTKVYILELDHTYVCEDRGSKITEGHLDVYIESLDEALEFGRQKMNVRIVEEGV